MSRDQNPYRHQKALAFPVADRELQEHEMQMARLSPTKQLVSPEFGRDQTDSAQVRLPAYVTVPTATPEYEESSAQMNIIIPQISVPLLKEYRSFFSIRTVIEILSVCSGMLSVD